MSTKPEELYGTTTDPTERRRLQAEVIAAYRSRVESFVRKSVAPQHREEAEQVGCLAILEALKKYDPTPREGYETPPAFWAYVERWVEVEVLRWLDSGVYWRPRSWNKKRDDRRDEGGATRRLHRVPVSMDAELLIGDARYTLHDTIETVAPTVEAVFAEAEALGRLGEFLSTLDAEERHLLTAERRERTGGGIEKGNNARARRYLALIERATAFVRGDDDGSGEPVLRSSTTLRVVAADSRRDPARDAG